MYTYNIILSLQQVPPRDKNRENTHARSNTHTCTTIIILLLFSDFERNYYCNLYIITIRRIILYIYSRSAASIPT